MTAGNPHLPDRAVRRLTGEAVPWLSCDSCFELIDQHVDALLAGMDAPVPAMAAHLKDCPACAEEARSLLLLAAAEAGIDPEPALGRMHGRSR